MTEAPQGTDRDGPYSPDSAAAQRYRDSRPMYTEARERMIFEKAEVKRADEKITHEIRGHCRPEIEEYIDCTTGRLFTVVACRDLAMRMRNCMKKYKLDIDLQGRRAEIIKEFEAQGEVLDRGVLSRRNSLYLPPETK
jgi:COX assembly protein 1